jgi:hypothetical protein
MISASIIGVIADGGAGHPFHQSLSFRQNDNAIINVSIINSNSNSVDVTGGTTTFTIRDSVNQVNILSTPVIFTLPSHGIGYFNIGATTTNISIGTYFYDLVYQDIYGNTIHLIRSSEFNIKRSIY